MSWHEFIFSDKPRQRARRHVIFWLLWWTYFAGTYYYYVQVGLKKIDFGDLSSILFLKTFLLVIIHMLSCYTFIYFLLPRYLLKARYVSFVAGTIILAVVLLFTGYYIHLLLFPVIDRAYHYNLPATNTLWWIGINSVLINAPKIIAAATAIKLVKRWYLKQKEKERVEKEKLTTDLQLLKAQIRPGFLFSSLDNIYSYAKNKSPHTPGLLLKFSDLLSYLLYECDEEKVLLEKELSMMKEYMFMEKIRYGENLEMVMEIKGDAAHSKIAPLLLLPFIENSFRQCNRQDEPSWINLEISIERDMLTMKLMNGTDPENERSEARPVEIVNVEKRLDLLYPGVYELKMFSEQEIYMTILKIDLNEKLSLHPVISSTTFNDQKIISYAVN